MGATARARRSSVKAKIEQAPRPPRIDIHGSKEARDVIGRSGPYDAVVVVTPIPPVDRGLIVTGAMPGAWKTIERLVNSDQSVSSGDAAAVLLPSDGIAGGRLVMASTGKLDRFTDDVRRYAEAGEAGMKKAVKAGAVRPLLVVDVPAGDARYGRAVEAALMGALGSLWRSVEARIAKPGDASKVKAVGLVAAGEGLAARVERAVAFEEARTLSRDLGGTQAEIMTPEAFASHVEAAFPKGPVKVSVERSAAALGKAYPLLMAVARGSLHVDRFRPRVVRLQYDPPGGKHEYTLYLVGKGVTYDTGGHDLKVGGGMAGMSRDKCGAAAVAGIMKVAARLRPEGVRIVGFLGLVRNSVDAEGYATDEVLTGRAGIRVRVGNTDAEGRLVLADLLARAGEEAVRARRPVLATLATLTGHAERAVGPYPIAVENGPARALGLASLLQGAGDEWGEPFEVSRLRREDYECIKAKTDGEDVLTIAAKSSIATPRGHQYPLAFLQIASGIEKHNEDHADAALPYVHLDIAGSAVRGNDWAFGLPTGSPVVPVYEAFAAGMGWPRD